MRVVFIGVSHWHLQLYLKSVSLLKIPNAWKSLEFWDGQP